MRRSSALTRPPPSAIAVGVEEADEGVDVLGFPCLLEVPDDAGLLGCRGRGSLRGADAAAG
jgi:hypothetical protein